MFDYNNFEKERFNNDKSDLMKKIQEDLDLEKEFINSRIGEFNDRMLLEENFKLNQENNTYLKKLFLMLLEIKYHHSNREDYMSTSKYKKTNNMTRGNGKRLTDDAMENIFKKLK
jgi:hypothetical protein